MKFLLSRSALCFLLFLASQSHAVSVPPALLQYAKRMVGMQFKGANVNMTGDEIKQMLPLMTQFEEEVVTVAKAWKIEKSMLENAPFLIRQGWRMEDLVLQMKVFGEDLQIVVLKACNPVFQESVLQTPSQMIIEVLPGGSRLGKFSMTQLNEHMKLQSQEIIIPNVKAMSASKLNDIIDEVAALMQFTI